MNTAPHDRRVYRLVDYCHGGLDAAGRNAQMDARAGLDGARCGHRAGNSRWPYGAEVSSMVRSLPHMPRWRRPSSALSSPWHCLPVAAGPGFAADHETGTTPSTPALATLAAACVWVQLILGAAFRHSGIKLLPHLIGACVVTAVLCWTIVRFLTRYGSVDHLRKPAQLLLAF